jgi:hypothetical protein
MRINKLACFASVVATIGLLAVAAVPARAAPVPSSTASLKTAIASPVTQARWVVRRWGWRGPGRYYWRGPGWYWGGAAAGAVIGGAIASRAYRGPVYYGPPAYNAPGYNDWLAYCSSRYRSFDPATGTFMGYDGHRHYCR